jgi:hypothetical protein
MRCNYDVLMKIIHYTIPKDKSDVTNTNINRCCPKGASKVYSTFIMLSVDLRYDVGFATLQKQLPIEKFLKP